MNTHNNGKTASSKTMSSKNENKSVQSDQAHNRQRASKMDQKTEKN
ncbi:hypothetical protein [Bartonella sp. B17]